MKKTFRSLTRIVVALLTGSLISVVPIAIFLFYESSNTDWFVTGMLLAVPVYILISFSFLLVVMLPLHLLVLSRVNAGWWVYSTIGLFCAIGIGIGFDLFTGGWSPLREYLYFAGLGLLVSFAFWYVLRPRVV